METRIDVSERMMNDAANELRNALSAMFVIAMDMDKDGRFSDLLNKEIPKYNSYEEVCNALRGTLSVNFVGQPIKDLFKSSYFEKVDDAILENLKATIESILTNKDREGLTVSRFFAEGERADEDDCSEYRIEEEGLEGLMKALSKVLRP